MLLIEFQLNWIIDFRGDVQTINSQHFSHITVLGPYKCMRSKFDLAVKRSNVNVGPSLK